MTRSLLRDVPVPVGSPADPLPTGPNDPGATPTRHRFLGGGRPRAVSRELLAWLRRNRPRETASLSSNPAGQHIPAWRDFASIRSADRWWKRGRTGRRGTSSPVSVPGQKRWRVLPLETPVWRAFQSVTQPWPHSILFGQEGSSYFSSAPVSRDSSKASTWLVGPPVPPRAAAVRSDSRTSWHRTTPPYESGSCTGRLLAPRSVSDRTTRSFDAKPPASNFSR